jgi:hypothetical protein
VSATCCCIINRNACAAGEPLLLDNADFCGYNLRRIAEHDLSAVVDANDVADIPDIPDMPTSAAPRFTAPAADPDAIADVSKGVAVSGVIFQLAACIVMGLLGYYLYNDMQLPMFCGGCQ